MKAMELLIDFHKDGERQGPGSTEDTLRALGLTGLDFRQDLNIADIGCGTGAQTLTLASHTRGKITALDIFPQLLNKLKETADVAGMSDQIKTVQGSMDDLPFEKESLDLIWSEGAIYIMGFEAGLKYWRDFLKSGGYLAVSEITWLTNERPKELEEFWAAECPEIATAGDKIKVLEESGYLLTGYFYLPQSSWLDNYYCPMEGRFSPFLERHQHSAEAEKMVDEHQAEINIYRKYRDFFSYGFYIAQKTR